MEIMKYTVLLDGGWADEQAASLEALLHSDVTLIREPGHSNFEIIVAGRPDAHTLDSSPVLKHLIIPWAGLPASTALLMRNYSHISVHNIHHNAASTAELAVTLMLAAARSIIPADRSLREGDWTARDRMRESVMISGSRILVLGYGHVGSRIGSICRAMGAEVTGIRRSLDTVVEKDGITLYPRSFFFEILAAADILVIALPLTPDTQGIIGNTELDILHDRAIIVNIGRGKLIDENSLYEHLKNRSIGAAGIDVWYNYPGSDAERGHTHPSDLPFHELDNIVMTPHMGGAFGLKRIEDLRIEYLARSINTAAEGGIIPCRIDLDRGY